MKRNSKFNLSPLELGDETFGRRLARLRKERGLTQQALAAKIGINQALITDYERDKLRLHAEMIVRFAMALNVTTDELLGFDLLQGKGAAGPVISRKILKRAEKIQALPERDQRWILKNLDLAIKGATAMAE